MSASFTVAGWKDRLKSGRIPSDGRPAPPKKDEGSRARRRAAERAEKRKGKRG